ncbi:MULTISPECIES: flavodoxin [unclassified Oceanobacter]|uniref:flavodoxin n=1 Tax=unclassified Oceanobacter TaxID=2620260 RepID=UPI0026E16B0D|nr:MULTISPECIES: flavodoxin [unclassified Oceanobacter]MDO6683302.1 flavodoxin [Oceanobacter sp. 5_MG-2023]MDP2504102.1 flavodoxin [Oceanobacter sp. 3_MG-2023]MDP2610065.1 flavodoxin [Oceanobacter sp. 1_MG-2023]MDP2613299.1 flavodoxin [Oceanobacter sp. 2_MG-2023]
MNQVGIFFGTDTGTTRLIGKKMAKLLGDELAAKPLNINRASLDDLLQYPALIIGTATYAEGQLPGTATNIRSGSWLDFLPQLEGADFSGKTVAIYGLGNQVKYGDRYCDAMFELYSLFKGLGANIIGSWSTDGYLYSHSRAVIDNRFVGLALDNKNQGLETEQRMRGWISQIKPELQAALEHNTALA